MLCVKSHLFLVLQFQHEPHLFVLVSAVSLQHYSQQISQNTEVALPKISIISLHHLYHRSTTSQIPNSKNVWKTEKQGPRKLATGGTAAADAVPECSVATVTSLCFYHLPSCPVTFPRVSDGAKPSCPAALFIVLLRCANTGWEPSQLPVSVLGRCPWTAHSPLQLTVVSETLISGHGKPLLQGLTSILDHPVRFGKRCKTWNKKRSPLHNSGFCFHSLWFCPTIWTPVSRPCFPRSVLQCDWGVLLPPGKGHPLL